MLFFIHGMFDFQAGYDTINSTHYYTLPGSFTNNAAGINSVFSNDSNVNVPGRWAFRVDDVSTGKSRTSRPLKTFFTIIHY